MIGDRIRAVRKHLNLNQTDFGVKLGVVQGAVTGWETGSRYPSESIIKSICREYKVNEEWLMTGNGNMFNVLSEDEELAEWFGTIQGLPNDDVRKRFMHMLRNLPPEGWQIIADAARFLAMKHEQEEGQE